MTPATFQPVETAPSGLTPASRGVRLAAQLIDWAISLLLLISVSLALLLFWPVLEGDAYIVSAFIAWVAIYNLIQTVLLHSSGQTMGKRMLDIRIVRKNGDRASIARLLLLRNCLPYVLSQLTFGVSWLVDSLWILGQENRCLHDHLADTVVIKANAAPATEPSWARHSA